MHRKIFFLILLCLKGFDLFAEGTIEGRLNLTNLLGEKKDDASNCFVYVFGKGYTETGEGKAAELSQEDRQFSLRSVAVVQGS